LAEHWKLVIRPTLVKSLLWFIAILLLVFSFPLQVYTMSPYPSLLPYLLISFIILLTLFCPRTGMPNGINRRQNRNINFMVVIYVFILLFNTTWQTVFGVISSYEGISALVIYLLPVIYYWYFRRIASEQEIRTVLTAMVIAGLIVGIYFAYDSYLKLALGRVSDYASAAFQYSLDRGKMSAEDANITRVNLGSRSFGLLTSHSVSGAWVILGALSALALLPQNRSVFRRVIIFVFGTMLLLGLNFTTIIAFSIIMVLTEVGGIFLPRSRPAAILGNVAWFTLMVMMMVVIAWWIAGDVMTSFILDAISVQLSFAFGTGDNSLTFIGLILDAAKSYYRHFMNYPLTLLFGDGFSSFGLMKGGDVGFIESMAKFGLPFFCAIVFGLLLLMNSGVRQIKTLSGGKASDAVGLFPGRILQFAICITLLVLITEVHYTVWADKSILPIVFFAIAIYGRYLSGTSPGRLVQKEG
jgi:hypothetical protein